MLCDAQMNRDQSLIDRIRQWREAGDSFDQIATALNLHWDALGRILRTFETEALLAARSDRFL